MRGVEIKSVGLHTMNLKNEIMLINSLESVRKNLKRQYEFGMVPPTSDLKVRHHVKSKYRLSIDKNKWRCT